MESEQSVFLQDLTRRVNLLLHQRKVKSREEADLIINDVINDVLNDMEKDGNLLTAEGRAELESKLEKLEEERANSTRKIRLEIVNGTSKQFGMFERCVTFAELISNRLEDAITNSAPLLLEKSPRPQSGAVTGAMLKCLMLLALYSKARTIASEIIYLLKGNFLDAANARLRTFHEHIVVITLIMNDHTYEISERYQDHAVFEDLPTLRAYRRNYKEAMYVPNPAVDNDIRQRIAMAEQVANEALTRWGPAIEEQYGWARPALPRNVRHRRRIYFTDLERASGADFLRGDYLTGNNHVHAGAYAAINYLNFAGDGRRMVRSDDCQDGDRLAEIAQKAITYLSAATAFTSKGISAETEEYDEYIVAVEMQRYCERSIKEFRVVEGRSQSSRSGEPNRAAG